MAITRQFVRYEASQPPLIAEDCGHSGYEGLSVVSDFSFTNSLATSSVVRWLSILRMVQPVSSMFTLRPSDRQQARALPEGGLASGRRGEDELYLVHDVFELHDRHPDQLVVPAEAVVLHPDVKFIRQHLLFVPDDAERIDTEFSIVLRC